MDCLVSGINFDFSYCKNKAEGVTFPRGYLSLLPAEAITICIAKSAFMSDPNQPGHHIFHSGRAEWLWGQKSTKGKRVQNKETSREGKWFDCRGGNLKSVWKTGCQANIEHRRGRGRFWPWRSGTSPSHLLQAATSSLGSGIRDRAVQGHLTHKKTPPPPQGPP